MDENTISQTITCARKHLSPQSKELYDKIEAILVQKSMDTGIKKNHIILQWLKKGADNE